jgi:hypothetical protein
MTVIVGTAAALAALAGRSPAQQPNSCTCSSDFVAYETGDKERMNELVTVATPFDTGTVLLTRTHRLLVPATINGTTQPGSGVHYLGVETDNGSYDTKTTPERMFSTSLGAVTFKPGGLSFFYDPTSKAPVPNPAGPAPSAAPLLCFKANTGSKGPKADITTTDQFGTQHPMLMSVDYACVAASLSGPAPSESWIVCLKQRTKDAVKPPHVNLVTQDLGSFPDMKLDPIDEVCVQAQVQ